LADGGEPAKGSSKRHDVTGKVGDCRKLLPQGIQYISTYKQVKNQSSLAGAKQVCT